MGIILPKLAAFEALPVCSGGDCDSRLGTADKGAGLRRRVSLSLSFPIMLNLEAHASGTLGLSLH